MLHMGDEFSRREFIWCSTSCETCTNMCCYKKNSTAAEDKKAYDELAKQGNGFLAVI